MSRYEATCGEEGPRHKTLKYVPHLLGKKDHPPQTHERGKMGDLLIEYGKGVTN